ncbi:helix-turn-helix transcriptional regulator [Pseudomonas sp. SWRI107]|uniref:helix-turn-helix transcriptional regulator n=1 Tax=Pseudomonas TaxID=286 RepID=UPI0016483D69|nr:MULTISPECIES: helix-turn-helix transcriptional regulator [Pseudomonas]MBC3411954.1 helix-turn-helix transcriptional regulator [Pseudomonas sp. SWRI51]MBV4529926.1 helix-turn-helix transcriptional regulator [Pseudomonas farsensis]
MSKRTYSPITQSALQLFSQLIALKRRERGLTQQNLAERLGVTRGTLRRLEAGDPKCEIGLFFELAYLLGIHLFDAPERYQSLAISIQDKLAVLPTRVQKTRQEVDNDF